MDADFDEVAARLYAVPPGEFVAARDEQVRHAREQGRRELADTLRRLRRPTHAAWLLNLLVRERRDTVEELLASSEQFQAAYESGHGDRIRELSARRARLTTDLVRAAREIGTDRGVRVTADTVREIEQTLGAALVDPEVAEQVRCGRLDAPAEYAGFGPAWSAAPTSEPDRAPAGGRVREERPAAPKGRERRPPRRERTDAKRSAAETRREEKARRAAEERAEAARTALGDAERELAEREAALEDATRRRTEAEREVTQTRARLRDLEKRLAALDRGVRAESKRRDRAAAALASARRRLEQATHPPQ